jgi:CBS domain-containing protein
LFAAALGFIYAGVKGLLGRAMFFVYGTSGQVFRGNLEQLRQVKGVGALSRARLVAPIGRDGSDGDTAPPAKDSHRPQRPSSGLSSYAQTQRPAVRQALLQVGQIMSREPVCLPDTLTLAQAWRVLAQRGVGQAPVLDAAGQLVGLLTRADMMALQLLPDSSLPHAAWAALLQQTLKSVMRTPVPGVAATSDIHHVAQALLEAGLPGLPVVDEQGRVIGFISRTDILQAVVSEQPLDLWG